jgi:preprotein translocase subunit SecG
MTLTILNILYVLVAIAMVGFILMQRGAGAQAGSGFGAGASATVFGARGAASFLTRSTAVLATAFFVVSLGMGMFIAHTYGSSSATDLGVMGRGAPTAPAQVPAPATEVPAAPASEAPASEVPDAPASEAPASEVPDAPAPTVPAEEPPKE